MPERTLRDLIADGRVHLFDGAMGTMLYAKGVFINVCYDELNLKAPDLVQEIHQAYVKAGAEILETNTFGANPVKLGHYGLVEETYAINRRAAELARAAGGARALVAGAIGPLGIRLEPFGETSRVEAFELFKTQAQGLLEGGVHGFVLETFSDLDEIHEALRAVRAISDLPVFAQMTIQEDGATAYGHDPESLARALDEYGADVIGLNCSVGPQGMLEAIERMARVTSRPLSAQPNAGLPRQVGDRKIYMASPEYTGEYAKRLVEAAPASWEAAAAPRRSTSRPWPPMCRACRPGRSSPYPRSRWWRLPASSPSRWPSGRVGARSSPPGRFSPPSRSSLPGEWIRAQCWLGRGSSMTLEWTRSTCPTDRAPRAGWAR